MSEVEQRLSVRPFTERHELKRMIRYFHAADAAALTAMAVDRSLLPPPDAWLDRLVPDLGRPLRAKLTYYVGWYVGDELVGHSNAVNIEFGVVATVHLHLWIRDRRRGGLGKELFRLSVGRIATDLELRRVICEPFADNPAPNRVLPSVGFRFERRYRTTPGPLNPEQDVNRWELTVR